MRSFISTADAARKLDITIRGVQKLIERGRLPAGVLVGEHGGKTYVIDPLDVAKLLKTRRK